MATTVRSIMTASPTCVRTDDIVLDAAAAMAEHGVGAVPICGKDDRLKGIVTDRDLVTKVLAKRRDNSFPAGDSGQQEPVTVSAEDSITDAASTMAAHQIKRLPVLDGSRLVGMVSLADLAPVLPDNELAALVRSLHHDGPTA